MPKYKLKYEILPTEWLLNQKGPRTLREQSGVHRGSARTKTAVARSRIHNSTGRTLSAWERLLESVRTSGMDSVSARQTTPGLVTTRMTLQNGSKLPGQKSTLKNYADLQSPGKDRKLTGMNASNSLRTLRKGLKMKKLRSRTLDGLSKPIVSVVHIVLAIVLVILYRFLSHHLNISWS